MLSQEELERLAVNPTRGIALVVNEIEQNWYNGTVSLNSRSHPAVLCMDLILGTAHGFHNRLHDAVSKTFAMHARDLDDLSRNMSDEERIGLLASPSVTTFQLIINTDVIENIGVDYEESLGRVTSRYKKLLVPKDTEINVADYVFAIENGIEIRYNNRTGYQVVYDSTTNSPFNPISTNVLNRNTLETRGQRFLIIDVPVRQLRCTPNTNISSNESSGCSGTIDYLDYLYGIRAFFTNSRGTQEIRVSYDQDTFDPASLTLAIKLDTTNNRYSYEIPDVYITNGLGIGTLSIYTYGTLGELNKNITSTPVNEFTPNYQDYRYGPGQLNAFSDGLRNSNGIAWRCLENISGGQNPAPFSDIKEAIIDGRRQRQLPITENNLSGRVQEFGYNSVKSIDFVTGRSYSLTKELPIQDNKGFSSAMGCFVGSHLTSVNELKSAGVVLDNGYRVTIPHNVLFDVTDPTSKLVTAMEQQAYLSLTKEAKVDLVNHTSLIYTPFYHVFDLTSNQVSLRTYHLDKPKMNYQTFVAENTVLGLEVGIGAASITHVEDGYILRVQTKSGKSYQELADDNLGLQLSVGPKDSGTLASIAGVMIGKTEDQNERVWEFKLDSRFDVDVNDVIYFNNFNQFGYPQLRVGVDLDTDLVFIFTVAGDNSTASTDSDDKIDQTLFRKSMIAIIESHYSVTFGKQMGNFYSRIRPLVGLDQYKKYDYNVPKTYATDEYKRDANGDMVFDPVTKKPIIEHKAGDPVIINGVPQFEYIIGDYMKDANGNLIILEPKDLRYHWDFIGFDAAYYFADDKKDIEFAGDTKDYFVGTISKDMENFTSYALDRTKLYFQPRSKLGHQEVIINNNFESIVKQDLSFVVTYYLTSNGNRNEILKQSLKDTTPNLINQALFGETTVGGAELIDVLKRNAVKDVVDVKLSAFSGDESIDVVSTLDDLSGFSIRKSLALANDGVLSVKENVDIIFLEHSVKKIN